MEEEGNCRDGSDESRAATVAAEVQKSTGLSVAGDKRSKDPSRLCSLGWLMATRPMVTGDLCAIVRVPPLVHTRSLLPSSPASVAYVPLDKSILPGEGEICSANIIRKMEKLDPKR